MFNIIKNNNRSLLTNNVHNRCNHQNYKVLLLNHVQYFTLIKIQYKNIILKNELKGNKNTRSNIHIMLHTFSIEIILFLYFDKVVYALLL
jgi:hypothetical protein